VLLAPDRPDHRRPDRQYEGWRNERYGAAEPNSFDGCTALFVFSQSNFETGVVEQVAIATPPIHSTDKTSHSRNSPRATRNAMWSKPLVSRDHNTFGRLGQIKSQRSIMLCASRLGQSPLSCSFHFIMLALRPYFSISLATR